MGSLGNNAYAGTLHCEKLIASNSTDPHLITGDLEITGDLDVDGGVIVESSGFKGLQLKCKASVNATGLYFQDNINTWSISTAGANNGMFFGHTVNGAASGGLVGFFTYDPGTNTYGCSFPAGNGFQITAIPTTAPSTANTVWNNGGVLNITPP